MRCFPVCMDVEEGFVVLAGTGKHAREKLNKLLPYGCRIDLYAGSGFEDAQTLPNVRLIRRELRTEDLMPAPVFVVCADLPREKAEEISRFCRENRIPVNVVDVPELCSFYFPALITKGALTVAISTDGKGPAAATLLRRWIEPQLPDRMEEILEWSGELRQQLKQEVPDGRLRAAVLREWMKAAMKQNRPLTEQETEEIRKDVIQKW